MKRPASLRWIGAGSDGVSMAPAAAGLLRLVLAFRLYPARTMVAPCGVLTC